MAKRAVAAAAEHRWLGIAVAEPGESRAAYDICNTRLGEPQALQITEKGIARTRTHRAPSW